MLGLHHGPRLRALDAAHGGSLVDAQTAPCSPAAWPDGPRWARRLGDDGRLRLCPDRGPTVTRASTSSPPPAGESVSPCRGLTRPPRRREPVGTFCLVLHSHLPWLAHHGRWPVGEEWLHQSWAHAYLPVLDVVRRLAAEGRRDLLTLGVTPVLAAQLDDPHCLRGVARWLGGWQLRAHSAAPRLPDLAAHEFRAPPRRWPTLRPLAPGASPLLRPLVDAGAVELLGGPATHPFGPLLLPEVARSPWRPGLADAALRLGAGPAGIWAPECGYAPGMEAGYAAAGVGGSSSTAPRCTATRRSPGPSAPSDVLRFGRDLEVTYRVWSPRAGYPGGPDYRDFHTFDHASGFSPPGSPAAHVAAARQAALRPGPPAAAAVAGDAADFVSVVRETPGRAAASAHGRPGARRSRRSTPSSSATGGTRARPGWRPCCARCRTRACG